MTLTEFLLARIAEDESVARGATSGPWLTDPTYPDAIYGPDGAVPVGGSRWGGGGNVFDSDEDAHHIVRWHPPRVLAECESKRRLVALLPLCRDCGGGRRCVLHDASAGAPSTRFADDQSDLVARLLALPYASHPDYDETWRPA